MQTIKRLFLTILCVVGLSLNFVVADNTANLPKETDYEKLEKNIPNLPKSEQENQKLNEFFDTIINGDLDKAKEILHGNPNLVNLLGDSRGYDKNGRVSFLGHLISAETANETKISAILKYSQNFGMDLNQICLAVKSKNEPLFYIHYPLSLILILDTDGEAYFDLFKFFAENKTSTTNALYFTIMKLINNNDENLTHYLQTTEYKNLREKYKKYIYEIFKNYNIGDFSNSEIILSGIEFIKLNDKEFIELLVNSGLKQNKIAYDEILKFANDKNASKEILDLLK